METAFASLHLYRWWGSYPTYEEWKQCNALLYIKVSEILVLILPMRNGNNTTYHPFPVGGSICSYPTYEEWKPYQWLYIKEVDAGSYPTYEEWKLSVKIVSSCFTTVFLSYL